MKTITLDVLFKEKEWKELYKILDKKDKDALAKFCKDREKELDEKGIYEKYLYHFLCYKFDMI